MQKKFLVSLLFLSLVFNSFIFFTPPLSAAGSFPDTRNHWAEDYIQQLSGLNYLAGYPDGTFKPDRDMSKAEFITVLTLSLGVEANDKTTLNYRDTAKHWALPRINEAVRQGILVPAEDPDGLRPDDSIKRSQAAAMLVRALGKAADNGPLPFNDRNEVEKSMYRGHIKTAYDLGLIAGFPDGNFEPFRNMTRAQVCTVISKFLTARGISVPLIPSVSPSGSIDTLALGELLFDLRTTPIYIKINFTDIKISSITAAGSSVLINGSHKVNLESGIDNPDLIINENRYAIRRYSLSGNKLVAYPSCRKFNRISPGTYTYNSDYIKLFINSVNSERYLSDLDIIDENTVKMGDKSYNLIQDKITIQLDKDFYDIKRIILGDKETTPQLNKTDPVLFEGLAMSDVLAIFTGTTTLNLTNLSRIDFVLGGKRYTMSQLKLDAKGNFTAGGNNYPPAEAIMIINGSQYRINHIDVNNSKFIFYCDAGSTHEWVIINNEYRNPDDVRILWDGGVYELDEIITVKRNVLRIKGRQYDLDSSFKLRFDNKTYDIDRIDYDASVQATVIETGKISTGYLANQPQKFIFFKGNSKLREGSNNVSVYVNYNWVDFSQILIADPVHLTYKNSSYELIGSRIKIDRVEYKVVDTSWHGLSQVLDIYLEET